MFASMMAMSSMDKIPFIGFHNLSQKFGNILHLDLGTQSMAIIAGFSEIKQVHASDHAEDRAPLEIPNRIFMGGTKRFGILFNSGSAWKDLRRFTLRALRDLGLNKSASEDTVIVETKALVDEIRRQEKENNGVVELDLLFNKASLNVVWKFVSNQRFEYDDAKMHQLLRVTDTFMMIGEKIMGKPLGIFAILRFLPPFRTTYLECYNGVAELRDLIRETIDAHVSQLDTDDPKDYIDMFLMELGTQEHLVMEQLVICCLDLFTAGSETSSKGMLFSLALMIKYPEEQRKCQQEIDEVLQGRRLVTMEDKLRLPYTEATCNEILRYCNVVPVVAPRMTSKDIQVGAYTLREGTTVITNTYSVHMDPDHWKDPHVFNPSRFLDSQGVFRQDERNIPFGIGKRRCLGEGLARMENFLFFANLLLNFSFTGTDGVEPSLEPVVGFSNGPQPYSTTVQSRI